MLERMSKIQGFKIMFQIIAKNKYTLSQMKMMWSCKSKVKSKE